MKSLYKYFVFFSLLLVIICVREKTTFAAYDKTYDKNYTKAGYHLENAWSDTKTETLTSATASYIYPTTIGLNTDDRDIDNNIVIKLAKNAPDLQITNRWNEIKTEYTGVIGLNPVAHYMEISNVGNSGNGANKFGYTVSTPYNREYFLNDVNRWGYAYFGIAFAYSRVTKMYYFVKTYHTWYSLLDGTTGTNGAHDIVYTNEYMLYNVVPNAYKIRYNAGQGAGIMAEQQATYDTDITLNSNTFVAPEGKSFVGWKDQYGNTYTDRQSVKNLTAEQNGTVTLTAQYTGDTYTIQYNSNGGSGAIASQTFKYDDSIYQTQTLQKNTFNRINYLPGDWCTTPDGKGTTFSSAGGALTKQLIKEAKGNKITLYAKWNQNTYQIRYLYDNSPTSREIVETVEKDASERLLNINLLGFAVKEYGTFAISESGFRFLAWNDSITYSGKSYNNMASFKNLADVGQTYTLYGRWYADLNYNKNFDGAYERAVTQTIREADSFTIKGTIFTNPTGYKLTGWNTKREGSGTSYEAGKTYTKEYYSVLEVNNGKANLYAQWKPIDYTIRFDSNGGTGSMEDLHMTYDAASSLPACNFTAPAGKVFTGWIDDFGNIYNDQAFVNNLASTDGAVVTLHAQWKNNTYTIIFDNNGAAALMEDQTVNCNETVKLFKNNFEKYFSDFQGWNTKADGTGTTYTDEAEVKDLAPAGETITLYAQWENYAALEKGSFLLVQSTFMRNGKIIYDVKSSYTKDLPEEVQLELKTSQERYERQDYLLSWYATKDDVKRFRNKLEEKQEEGWEGIKYMVEHMHEYIHDIQKEKD